MTRKNSPPKLELLDARIRDMGEAVDADAREIEQLKEALWPAGLWSSAGGDLWTFHHRRPAPRKRAS
ncbi:MAG: hypothetical protein HYX53_09120 [Chloroflexi bacterium]|nr:hypothetical protein [Chloroflexota bacterium]